MVTLVWSANFLAAILLPKYTPPLFVHIAMMAVIAAAFGINLVQKKEDDK